MLALPTLVSMAVLALYSRDNVLTPEVIFPALGYFNLLQSPAMSFGLLVLGRSPRTVALLCFPVPHVLTGSRGWLDSAPSPTPLRPARAAA